MLKSVMSELVLVKRIFAQKILILIKLLFIL